MVIEEIIPFLVNEDTNHLFTSIQIVEEIKAVIFIVWTKKVLLALMALKDSCLTFWDIIKYDVIRFMSQFFIQDWIMSYYNLNYILLIPKTHNASSIICFRTITLGNYKTKIITKVIVDNWHQPCHISSLLSKKAS